MKQLFKSYFGLILVLVFVLVIFMLYRSRENAQNDLKEHKLTTVGTVVNGVGFVKPGGISLEYEYSISGHKYSGRGSYSNFSPYISELFIGKSFPVVCNYMDPKSSYLLLRKSDFEEFEIDFPDSLQWVEEKIRR